MIDRLTRLGTLTAFAIVVSTCVFAIFAAAQQPPIVGPPAPPPPSSTQPAAPRPPNILLIVADDLGVAELGCYGQTRIHTPNIDTIAQSGMRFTQAYSAAPVCAPSRCALLTGRNMAHAAIRDNKEVQPEGQQPLPADEITLAEVLKTRGYVTACIGKWGLGPPRSEGDPLAQGFDHFFGYNCQRHAHDHYPTWLYRDRQKITLEGNVEGNATGAVYAPDLMRDEALQFMRDHRDESFFLYYSTTVPHAALQVPEDSLRDYAGAFEETPYDGSKGYLPHPTPRAAYAAMVSRLDRDVGRMLTTLEELQLANRTIVIFTSDNGPASNGGTDSAFFQSTGGLRGHKGQLYEGGIRVPLLVRWPRRVPSSISISQVAALYDLLPTLAAITHTGEALPANLDGVDLSRPLLGGSWLNSRAPLYWEYAADGFSQAALMGDYKAVRRNVRGHPDDAHIEIYDLTSDGAESRDIASQRPDLVRRMLEFLNARTPSSVAEWNP